MEHQLCLQVFGKQFEEIQNSGTCTVKLFSFRTIRQQQERVKPTLRIQRTFVALMRRFSRKRKQHSSG